MSNFPIFTLFSAGLFVLLIHGLVASDASQREDLDTASLRRICEAENVTDVQIHECTIRHRMQHAVEARLNRRIPVTVP
jgi:hypothetical protein